MTEAVSVAPFRLVLSLVGQIFCSLTGLMLADCCSMLEKMACLVFCSETTKRSPLVFTQKRCRELT